MYHVLEMFSNDNPLVAHFMILVLDLVQAEQEAIALVASRHLSSALVF